MRKIILFIPVLVCFIFSGCKKQVVPTYYCKNTCYVCYLTGNYRTHLNRCNTDYSEVEFQDRMREDSLAGLICKEVEPTIFYEVSGDNNAQIDSHQSQRLTCVDKDDYNPQYFDYPAFAATQERCNKCYDTIAKHYLTIYFDTLVARYHFCSECGDATSFINDTAVPYATQKINSLGMHCGNPNSAKFARNLSTYFQLLSWDNSLPAQERNYWINLDSWTDFNSQMKTGLNPVIFKECN